MNNIYTNHEEVLINTENDDDQLIELQAKVLKHIILDHKNTPERIKKTKDEIARLKMLMRQYIKDLIAVY